MFIEERHREILKRLNASGTITTAEIQRLFGIGYDSAKRDLRILEEKGLLKRTHGGAISLSAPERKETLRIVKDERPDIVSIARYAVSLIKPDEVVFSPGVACGLADGARTAGRAVGQGRDEFARACRGSETETGDKGIHDWRRA